MAPKEIQAKPIKNPLLKFFLLSVSTGLGTGYSKFAPGTVGSLIGIPLGLWWLQFPTWVSMSMAAALLLILVPITHRSCQHWGIADASMITADEVLGQAITLIGLRYFVRAQGGLPTWEYILAAFIVFRLLDIVKPFPAKTLDRKPNGWGVMMDDVVAGVYGALALHAAVKIFVHF